MFILSQTLLQDIVVGVSSGIAKLTQLLESGELLLQTAIIYRDEKKYDNNKKRSVDDSPLQKKGLRLYN